MLSCTKLLRSFWPPGAALTELFRRLLYPPEPSAVGPSKYSSNLYQPFRLLDSRFEESLRAMIRDEADRMEDSNGKGLNGELE